jgi:hypothetical protein
MLLATAAAPARTLPELERALMRQPPHGTSFQEYRFSRLMTRAAVATGTLEYRESDVWVRAVETPRRERAEIIGDEVRIRRASGAERRFDLARAPQLRMLLQSLQALLGGRLSTLEDEFELSLVSQDSSWGLRLTPRDARLAKQVVHIDVFGSGDAATCIEVSEPDGDVSFTLLGVRQPDRTERVSIESQCRVVSIGLGAR